MTTQSSTPADQPRADFTQIARISAHRDALAATRRVMLLLAVASTVVALAQALTGATPVSAPVLVVAAVLLVGSVLHTFRTRRQGPGAELVALVATGAIAYATDPSASVVAVAIALMWFCALFGTRRASLARPLLYAAVLVVAATLPSVAPGLGTDHPIGSATRLAWSVPVIVLTAVVARLVSEGVHAGSMSARLGGIQVRLANRLLGRTDYAELVRAAWQAQGELCEVFPELRLAHLVERTDSLEVRRSTGPFARTPDSVPRPPGGPRPGRTRFGRSADPTTAALDDAAGAPCEWLWIKTRGRFGDDSRRWIVLGAPGSLPAPASAALELQMDEVNQALHYHVVHEQLAAQAYQDQLTGLHNRASFLAELTTALGPDDEALSVLFIDLDGFKEINDLFGHRAGDRLLTEAARRLREATGPGAVCARIGGDEFGVLLRGTDDADATATARAIARTLAATTHPDGSPAHIGACIGIANANGCRDASELLHRADIAMYASKATGKGRISTYAPSLPQRDLQQAAFERELAGAAAGGQLVVHYQPVVSYPDRRCTAVEALVRWQHPERGLLYPDAFISTAERTGAIRAIGAAVLRDSLRDISRWRQDPALRDVVVHVNVSALQLEDDDLLVQVREHLDEYGLGPHALVLEVTESLAISSTDAVRRLHRLAEQGITLAIDDFGTGYSALQTLRTLPIRIVKIDRSFVSGSADNREDRAVVESIVHMAEKLGLSTIAEGVEDAEQQGIVQSIGASGGQGYLYRRPGSAEDLDAWFAEHVPALQS